MKTIFTTAGLHPRDRFEYWHDEAERVLTGHDSRAVQRDRFDAELRAADLVDFGLYAFTNGAMACERSRKHIANGATDDLFLCRNGSGRFALEQNERRNVFQPGDLVLIDSNQRYAVEFTDNSQMLMLKVPRRILESRLGEMTELLGARLAGQPGLNDHLSMTLTSICDNVDGFDEATAMTVRNHLVDLLVNSLGALQGKGKSVSTPRALHLQRLKGVLRARLADPSLDSVAAAAAAGLSVRYANALLEAEGASLARLIRDMRLERCKASLADPAQHGRTVGEIAFAWGFRDLSHFGRLFAATYGFTPTAFRRAAGEQGPSDDDLLLPPRPAAGRKG